MSQPHSMERFKDRLALLLLGGVRVRVWEEDGRFVGAVGGQIRHVDPQHILNLVLDLQPDQPGTIHLNFSGNSWRVKLNGVSTESAIFSQRLRNVLVNRA